MKITNCLLLPKSYVRLIKLSLETGERIENDQEYLNYFILRGYA